MTLAEASALPPAARFRVEWALLNSGHFCVWRTFPASKGRVSGWEYLCGPLGMFVSHPDIVYTGEAVAFDSKGNVLVLGDDGSVRLINVDHLRVLRPPVPELG